MSKISNEVCLPRASARGPGRLRIIPLAGLLVLALLMALVPARAEDADDDYLQVLFLVKQGDDLDAGGQAAPAKAKYQQALTDLVAFQQAHPEWNPKMVAFRVKSITQKVAAMTEKLAAPPASATSTNASDTATGTAAAAPASGRQIKLLEPGAEPRQTLRLHPAPEDKQTMTLTLKMGVESKVGDMAIPAQKLPALKMALESNVKQVDNGTITFTLVVNDVSLSDEPGAASEEMAGALKTALAGVKGLSGTGTVSSQGTSGGFEMDAPSGSSPQASQVTGQMKDMFQQLIVPMPEEAVGVGAKWEVKLPVKSQGMTLDQTATYELVSLEGERLTLKSTLVQSAANQKIQNPAMPAAKMDVTKMSGKGTAECTLDLAHLLPMTGSGNSHTDTAMSMNMGGQKQAMSMKVDIDIRFESK